MISVLRAHSLFDGAEARSGPVQVAIEDGRILDLGRPSEVAESVEVVDLGSATLVPGLVDAHTHLCWTACADPVSFLQESDDAALVETARRSAASALRAGVTTVRDLGDRSYLCVGLRDELRRDPASGPEIVAAGPPITTRGGHCWFLGGEADAPDDLRLAVRERAERGVDVIKLMATGGNLTPEGAGPHESQYLREQMVAVVDEAHRLGLPVTAHAHGRDGIADAVAAGVDGIEHGGFWTETSVEAVPEVIAEIARKGIFVTMTPGFASKGRLDPSDIPVAVRTRLAAMQQVFLSMLEAGVLVAIATDAGIAAAKSHDALPYALAGAVAGGFTSSGGLAAMTSVAAEAAGVGDRKGRIRAGFDADLLAVDDDPLADPTALTRPVGVFRAGVRVI